jgi:hypothetical protein
LGNLSTLGFTRISGLIMAWLCISNALAVNDVGERHAIHYAANELPEAETLSSSCRRREVCAAAPSFKRLRIG